MKIEQRTTETAFLFEQEPYSRILSSLGEGARNGIKTPALSNRVNIEVREMRKIIEYIRRKGVVIIADRNGYYFPESIYEVERYAKQEERRAKSSLYTSKSARTLLRELTPYNSEANL